ncbi:MAG: AI-2E family transporter, partial [Actinomycetota bacterium]
MPADDGSLHGREAGRAVSLTLPRAGIVAWSILGILALTGAGGWILYQVRAVFPPLVLALMIIFLLNPAVSALQRRGVPRVLGTIAIYLLFVMLVAAVGLLLAKPISGQVQG